MRRERERERESEREREREGEKERKRERESDGERERSTFFRPKPFGILKKSIYLLIYLSILNRKYVDLHILIFAAF